MPSLWIIWYRTRSGRFGLSSAVESQMRRFVQDQSQKQEAGGVLLGRRLIDSEDVVVDQITTPFPSDCRTRSSFIRMEQGHQQAVTDAWVQSNGTTVYLGEWHTHAEPKPEPSPTDLADWHRKSEKDSYGNGLFFVILGSRTLVAWESPDGDSEPVPLSRHEIR